MSEGRKVIVVGGNLEKVVLREQLKGLGIDVEVSNDADTYKSIIGGLLLVPTTKERMKEAFEKGDFTGNFVEDGTLLVDEITALFKQFTHFHPKTLAMRDGVIGRLTAELGLIGLEERREKPVEDIVPKFLTEILSELKDIKDAVKGPSVTVSMQPAQEEAPVETFGDFNRKMAAQSIAIANLLSEAEKLNIPNFVDNLKELLSGKAPLADLNDLHNHPAMKAFLTGSMLSVPQMVEGMRWLQNLFEIIRNFEKSVSGDVVDFSFTSGNLPVDILEQLSHEFWVNKSGQITLKGLDSLSDYDRGVLTARLKAASNREPAEVKTPGTKEDYIGYLNKALSDPELEHHHPALSVARLSIEDRRDIACLLSPKFSASFHGRYSEMAQTFSPDDLFANLAEALYSTHGNLHVYGLNTLSEQQKLEVKEYIDRARSKPLVSSTELLVGGNHTEDSILCKLLEALHRDDVDAITVRDLKGIDPVTRKNLRAALKAGVMQLADLRQVRDNFIVHGQRHVPAEIGEAGVKNIAATLGEFARAWSAAAEKCGIQVNSLNLASHLLEEALKRVGKPVPESSDEDLPAVFLRSHTNDTVIPLGKLDLSALKHLTINERNELMERVKSAVKNNEYLVALTDPMTLLALLFDGVKK